MDKKYYYRALGLQQGATNQQIKKAFESRMARLSSPDYADDPEYVAKKMSQAKYAYSVLMGSAAPMTKAQRKKNYECYKDDIEDNRDADHFIEKHGRRMKNLDASVAAASAKQKLKDTFGNLAANSEIELPKGMGKIIAAVVIAVIPLLISLAGNLVGDAFDYSSSEPDYSVSVEAENADKEYVMDNIEAVDRILTRDMEYDFFGSLTYPDVEVFDDVEWELSDETYGQLWSMNDNLAHAMGIDSVYDMITYLTGDEDAFWNNDDQMISYYMVELMGAPGFSDIAGMENMYTGEVVLTYADYMEFLIITAEIQTDEICSMPAVDYYD
ncbi:MAG: hypothetical protein IJB73_02860 [Firmicutes bacterium]|nr:hypothetical protein [Bacillota bacterium]